MSKKPISLLLTISLSVLLFTPSTSSAQVGIYDKNYTKYTADLTPEQRQVCEDFTEWSGTNPSLTLQNHLTKKVTDTIWCSLGLKDNSIESLQNSTKTWFATAVTYKIPSVLDKESLTPITIPDYFSNRLTDDVCDKPKNITAAYSVKGRVGALGRNKFRVNSSLSVKTSKEGNLEVEEVFTESIFPTPTQRNFVLSPDYIRIESNWESSIENKGTTSFKTTSSQGGSRAVELSNKTKNRHYTGEGVVTRENAGCLKQANGQYSQLIRVEQPVISVPFTTVRINNPDSLESPLFTRTYLYETDIDSGKILAFAEIDVLGKSIHLFDHK